MVLVQGCVQPPCFGIRNLYGFTPFQYMFRANALLIIIKTICNRLPLTIITLNNPYVTMPATPEI
jgi:hypothetical protein